MLRIKDSLKNQTKLSLGGRLKIIAIFRASIEKLKEKKKYL